MENQPNTAVTRGIDHVGLTVPNIAAAERFLVDGLGAQFIYETLSERDSPLSGAEMERTVRLPPGAKIKVIRMYRLGNGPGIELFEYEAADQRPPARGCDFGWQHISLYVDDLEQSVARAIAAGAEQLNPPWSLMNAESGKNNRFCFLQTPFGALLEMVSFPSTQAYEATTQLRRWRPPAKS